MGISNIPTFKIGELELLLIQGGMGVGISMAGLASAVANEGGMGVIASVGLNGVRGYSGDYEETSARALREEIELARSKTTHPERLAVNIMRALTNYESLVKTAIAAGIGTIISGSAPSLDLPGYESDYRVNRMPIVSSAKAAGTIQKYWKKKYNYFADGFVVEGFLSGGHQGFKREQIFDPAYALEKLVLEVIEAVKPYEQEAGRRIPIIPAGGIYYGGDIRKFNQLGAAGVQIATRLVTTNECDAHINFKQAYLDCKKEDIIIIDSPVGLPGRAIRNKFLDEVKSGKRHPVDCPYYCLLPCKQNESPYCIADALVNAQRGNLDEGFVFCGSNAWRCNEIVSVAQVFQDLSREYAENKV